MVKPMGFLGGGFDYSNAAEDEFNDWYETEHVPALTALPGVLCARRFRSAGGGGHKYVAVYHLSSPEVCQSETWREAAFTPWTHKILAHTSDWLRLVLKRYVRAR